MRAKRYQVKQGAAFRYLRLHFILIAVVVLLGGASSAYDLPITNMIRNGALELGSTSPNNWVLGAGSTWATDESVSSSHSIKLTDNSTSGWVDARYYGFDVIGGKSYIAEWDWKYSDLSGPFIAVVRFYDGPISNNRASGNIITESVFNSGVNTQNAFVHNIEPVTAPSNARSGDIVFRSGQDVSYTGNLWCDNIIMRSAPNLVLNADAEYANGTLPDSWVGTSGTSWATDRKSSGSHALKISGSGGLEYWQSRAIPVFDNCETIVSCKLSKANLSGNCYVQVRWCDQMNTNGWTTGSIVLAYNNLPIPPGTDYSFPEHRWTLTPPAGAKFADILIVNDVGSTGTVWADDIAVWQKDRIGFSETPTELPAAKRPRRFVKVNSTGMSTAENVMVTSIQGIVAQVRPEIYIRYSSSAADQWWIDDMRDTWGIPYFTDSDAWWVLHNFKDSLINNRYILYNVGTDSENVATSLAGRFGAAMVDASIEAQAQAAGLVKFMDVRSGLSEQQTLDTYYQEMNSHVAMELSEAQHGLRDYSTFASVFTFADDSTSLRGSVFSKLLGNESFLLGFWPEAIGEGSAVNQASPARVSTVPSGQARNLSAYSGMVDLDIPLVQQTRTDPALQNKHYVAFLLTDGDNLKFNLLGMPTYTEHWQNSHRGQFNMGWGMAPTICDLAPAVLNWFYRGASNTSTGRDYFVCGPSGAGYMYPGSYPNNLAHAKMTADLMARCDLTEMTIIENTDDNGFDSRNYANYTAQPQIAGMFFQGNPYHEYGQTIRWSNGKPIVSVQYSLWDGFETASSLRDKLNDDAANPVSPYTQKGYSLVCVHCWTRSLDDVYNCVSGLDGNIKVVTPGELVRLISKAGDTSPWNFAYDEQGWSGEVYGGQNGDFDYQSGNINLSASESGGDTNPNVAYWNELSLTWQADNLSFKVRADSSGSSGNLIVCIKDAAGNYATLQSPTLISSTSYVTKTYDISAWRNQTVRICLELDGTSSSSSLDFDDVSISYNTTPDTTPPSGSIGINSGSSYTSVTSVNLNISATDNLSGTAEMRLSNNNVNWSAWEPYTTLRAWSIDPGDGVKTVYVQFRDYAGNASGSFAASIILDITAPAAPAPPTADAPQYRNVGTITWSWNAANDGAGSGIGQYWLVVNDTEGATHFSASVGNVLSKQITNLPPNKIYAAYVHAIDNLGNWSAWSSWGGFVTVDDIIPVRGSVSAPSFVNTVPISISQNGASDSGSGLKSTCLWYKKEGEAWVDSGLTLPGGVGPYSWTPPSEGKFYLAQNAEDNAGNITSGDLGDGDCSVTYDIDTTPPQLGMNINNNDLFSVIPDITLHLAATDQEGTVVGMRFSNDGLVWSDWEPYAAAKSWVGVPTDGKAIVRAQVKDSSDNISSVASDYIWIGSAVSISAAKQPASGRVIIDDVVVTAQFGDCGYIQSPAGPFGIKILNAPGAVFESTIDLVGNITLIMDEKAIDVIDFGLGTASIVRPEFMPGRAVGGSDWLCGNE